MNKEQEIELIKSVIEHPAGFAINLFGGLIAIRPHSDGFEVSWMDDFGRVQDDGPYQNFDNAVEAATFFVNKRYELELGIDIEAQLMKGF